MLVPSSARRQAECCSRSVKCGKIPSIDFKLDAPRVTGAHRPEAAAGVRHLSYPVPRPFNVATKLLQSSMPNVWQVLIDPDRRQVYDIYGREGLSSGLEVGEHLRTRDELRAQWQQFQQQQVRETPLPADGSQGRGRAVVWVVLAFVWTSLNQAYTSDCIFMPGVRQLSACGCLRTWFAQGSIVLQEGEPSVLSSASCRRREGRCRSRTSELTTGAST